MNEDIKTRELLPGEVIFYAFSIFFSKMKYIIPICIFVFLPISIFTTFMPNDLYDNVIEHMTTFPIDQDLLQSSGIYVNFMKYFLIQISIITIFTPLGVGALSHVTVCAIDNKAITLSGIMESSMNKWGRLVYTSILFKVILYLASVFFILPAIYVSVVFMFCECIAAISNKYGISALLISRELTKGRFFKAFSVLILTFLIKTGMLIFIGMGGYPDNMLISIIVSISYEILASFSYIAICLFYINIHCNYKNKEKQLL